MADYTIYTLAESNMTISGGLQLSGITQGNGSHLVGANITLNNAQWQAITVSDTDTDTSFQDSDGSQTLTNTTTIDGTTFSAGRRVEAEFALDVMDPDGNVYRVIGFNINEPGVTSFATVEALAFVGGAGGFPPTGVELTVVASYEGPSNPYSSLATPPCFVQGSLIDTPDGPKPVETLKTGDWVETYDNGPQQIRWIGRKFFPAAVLDHAPAFRPIKIAPHTFGPNQPYRTSYVSPQHRIVIEDWRAAMFFGEDEILVPAKKLVNDLTIRSERMADGVTYFHILFDRHEIVWADGLKSESYFLGDTADTADATAAEIITIFPQLAARNSRHKPVRPVADTNLSRVLAS